MRNNDKWRRVLELLRSKGFSSSIRLGIMIYLLVKRKTYFMDMINDLGLTPGNLWSHLTKLEKEGYIEIRYVISDRPRRLIVLTDKGFTETITLLNNLLSILGSSIEE